MYELVNILNAVVIFSCIGYLTAVIQKITVVRLKDNVQLSIGHILLEIVTVAVSVLFIIMNAQNPSNALVSNTCSQYLSMSAEDTTNVNYIFAILS